jgi:AcrR family transcriptional regulator
VPATRRKPTEQRRREIAAAALRILGEHGPTAFTTAALAEAVGVTTGALFRHFASLDEILDEVVRDAVERIEATLPPADLPPVERLRRLAALRVAALRLEPGLAWLLRSTQAARVLPARARSRLAALARRTRAVVLRAFDEARAAGTVRKDVPREALVLLFTATVHELGARPQGRGAPGPAAALDALFHVLAP